MFLPEINGDKKCRKERPRWANVKKRRIYGADDAVVSRTIRERKSVSRVGSVKQKRCVITGGKRKDDPDDRVVVPRWIAVS